jgi:hypothetical protein
MGGVPVTALLVIVLVFIAGWSTITAYGLLKEERGRRDAQEHERDKAKGGTGTGGLRLIQGGKRERRKG